MKTVIRLGALGLLLSGGHALAQFRVLHTFATNNVDGVNPQYGALAAADGRLYGTTGYGGANNNGVVFSIKADGSDYRLLHTFTGTAPDGGKPFGSVSLSGATLYGTTYAGGASSNGAVFKIGANGSGYQTLYSFSPNGSRPYATVRPNGSKLYGTTYYTSGTSGQGVIYSVETNGTGYAVLHTFASGVADGSKPMAAVDADGDTLYGTALHGGPAYADTGKDGVVFSVGADGTYSNLVFFTGGTANGANPYGSVMRKGSKLYGATRLGGGANAGTVFSVSTNGADYTLLYSFAGGTTNAANPYGTPIVDGNVIYGTTRLGGTNNVGTVFKINTDGSDFRILHHFSSADGTEPTGGLVLTNNTLYGYTYKGGSNNVGTVFALTVGEPGYAVQGTGITNMLTGSVNNGAITSVTVPTWVENDWGVMPYTLDTGIALPACERIVAGRLAMTVWGGAADYVCRMTVSVNGTTVPSADPFVFGTTAYSNSLYNAEAPRAYGSGYGVWFIAVPIPAELLNTDGSINLIRVEEDTPDYFDGRIQHVTLTAVYQTSALANVFDYSISEGEGLLYGYPVAPQVDKRTVTLDAVGTNDVIAADLSVLYTYGNIGQYDELFFNGTQIGGDDVAQGNAEWGGSYIPGVVAFDVTDLLAVTNSVTFDVNASDVSDPPEGSVRPELITFCVTREPLALRHVAVSAETGFSFQWSGSAVNTYTIQYSTDLSDPNGWMTLPGCSDVPGVDGVMSGADPSWDAQRFYRVIRR